MAPLLAREIPLGPNAMAGRELLIEVLLKAGFSRAMAAKAYAALARYVLGFAIQLGAHPVGDGEQCQIWQSLDPEAFPATASVAHFIPVPLNRQFSFGLELILDGLAHRLTRS